MTNRFKVFILSLVISFVLIMPANASKTQFFASITDLPLIKGFTEQIDKNIIFDTPEGRIIETTAVGMASKTIIMDFYNQTLPQLGWHIIDMDKGLYLRDNEILKLYIWNRKEMTEIKFILKPAKRAENE